MEVTVDFNISKDAVLDNNFIFCCDLLKLEEYKEFDKKVKKEYFTLYNSYLIIDTITNNHVESFKHLLKSIKIKNIDEVLLYCCGTTYNNITDYILKYNADLLDYKKYIDINIKSGSIYLIKKFNNVKLNNNWLILLAKKGKLSDVKWLSKKIKLSDKIFEVAIENNNTEVINWLREKYKTLHNNISINIINKWNRTKLLLTQLESGEAKEDCDKSECLWDETTLPLCIDCPEYIPLIIKHIYEDGETFLSYEMTDELCKLQHLKTIMAIKESMIDTGYYARVHITYLTTQSVKYLMDNGYYKDKYPQMGPEMFRRLDLSYIKKVCANKLIDIDDKVIEGIPSYSKEKQKFIVNYTDSFSELCFRVKNKDFDINYVKTIIGPNYKPTNIAWCIMACNVDIMVSMCKNVIHYNEKTLEKLMKEFLSRFDDPDNPEGEYQKVKNKFDKFQRKFKNHK